MKTITILFLLSLVAVLPLSAQDTQEGCSAEQVNAVTEQIRLALDQVQALVDSGDTATALESLQAISNGVQAIRGLCDGLNFEGTGDAVLGPIRFPDGFYRVTFTSDQFGTTVVEGMEGDCDFVPLLSITDMEGGEAIEALEFTGCVGLIEVSSSATWIIVFERLSVSE